jgi:hypothetical protein
VELDEIRQEYSEGKLDHIKPDLKRFLKVHKKYILEYYENSKKKFTDGFTLDHAVRHYICRHQTINHAKESRDQVAEIEREIRYRHEEDPNIPQLRIILDWTAKHAKGWRGHRVMQIIYVYVQDKDRYIELVK